MPEVKTETENWAAVLAGDEMTTIPESDRTLIIAEKTYLWLEDKAASERKKIKNPLLKQLRTPKSVAQKILAVPLVATCGTYLDDGMPWEKALLVPKKNEK